MGIHVDTILLRASCMLSLLGSLVTMLVCAQIGVKQKRKGRDLIFWLSFADFISSSVYFLSSFEKEDGKNTDLCKTYALISIFFPVASFLWTDFIAYYLYDMVVHRRNVTERDWSKLMKVFHGIAWGLSGLCILLVGSFGHAGKDEDSDKSNTGGWCWVHADNSRELIIWELIGGKLIEWTSCLIVLPYFYSVTISRLMILDNGLDSLEVSGSDSFSGSVGSRKSEHNSWSSYIVTPVTQFLTKSKKSPVEPSLSEELAYNYENKHYSDSSYRMSEDNLRSSVPSNAPPWPRVPPNSSFEDHVLPSNSYRSTTKLSSEKSLSEEKGRHGDSFNSSVLHLRQKSFKESSIDGRDSGTAKKASFRQFYLKMAVVPIVFFLCRIWGSVRVIIEFSAPSDSPSASASSSWLQTMQAIFDPSQGFFNAIIFVFMSQQDREAFFKIIYASQVFQCIRAIFSLFVCCDSNAKQKKNSSDGVDISATNDQRPTYQGEDSISSPSVDIDIGSSSFFECIDESSASYM